MFSVGAANKQLVAIQPNWNVIEIGGGANPCERSNVITNYRQAENQRDAKIKKVPGARMVDCDVQNMKGTFKDDEFDYSLCVQVLEHVEDPIAACEEIMRISKRGYIETPSILCEQLIGWEFHRWFVRIDEANPNKLTFIKKEDIHFARLDNFFHDMFYKPNRNMKQFKRLFFEYSRLFLVRFSWDTSFDVEVIE